MLNIWLLIFAALSIIILGVYALYLQFKLKQKRQQQIQQKQQAEINLLEFKRRTIADILFIAKAMQQQQCELTEGVLRVYHLLVRIDEAAWHSSMLTHTRHYYCQCKDMPILEGYKKLSNQQKYQQDCLRIELERTESQNVLAEMQDLIEYLSAAD